MSHQIQADKNFEPLFDAAGQQLDLTFSASDALDTKTLAILAFNVALGIYALQSLTSNSLVLRVPLFTLLLISILLNFIGVWPRSYSGSLPEREIYEDYLQLESNDLHLQMIADYQAAVDRNTNYNILKSRLCTVALLCSLGAIILTISCIL